MARLAARFTAVVVLPTPPFWLAMVMIRQAAGRGQAVPLPLATSAAWAARAIGVSGAACRLGPAAPSWLVAPEAPWTVPSVGSVARCLVIVMNTSRRSAVSRSFSAGDVSRETTPGPAWGTGAAEDG